MVSYHIVRIRNTSEVVALAGCIEIRRVVFPAFSIHRYLPGEGGVEGSISPEGQVIFGNKLINDLVAIPRLKRPVVSLEDFDVQRAIQEGVDVIVFDDTGEGHE